MDILTKIAEARIRDAMQRGELDNLSLRGQPLRLEDLSRVPEELRIGFKILKDAGLLPEELEVHKEIVTLETLIRCCEDDERAAGLRRRLGERQLRFRILRERRLHGPAFRRYGSKIRRKLGL